MTARKPVKIPPARIERVTQSPMNEYRWCLDLDCGHEEWVTSQRRPTRQTIQCGRCQQKAREMAR